MPLPLLLLQLLGLLIAGVIGRQRPPPPRHAGSAKSAPDENASALLHWTPSMRCNIWELSGQLEGDIMEEDGRNAVTERARLWPKGEVPYYIEPEDFDKEEREVIRGAIKTIEEETCIVFRPFVEGDNAYVMVRGDGRGCWSYVGRREGGQTLNLSEKCVRHGVAVHELLHALGLHHQQSSHDRDQYITVHWENIEQGHVHNFDKYNESAVTDYGVGYDYASIMHYSAYAFSKNEQMTITPKDKKVKIGQRKGLSKKDILKLNKMYNCGKKQSSVEEEDSSELGVFSDLF